MIIILCTMIYSYTKNAYYKFNNSYYKSFAKLIYIYIYSCLPIGTQITWVHVFYRLRTTFAD